MFICPFFHSTHEKNNCKSTIVIINSLQKIFIYKNLYSKYTNKRSKQEYKSCLALHIQLVVNKCNGVHSKIFCTRDSTTRFQYLQPCENRKPAYLPVYSLANINITRWNCMHFHKIIPMSNSIFINFISFSCEILIFLKKLTLEIL